MLDAGAVDQRIAPAVTRADRIENRVHGLRGGDIKRNGFHVGAALSHACTRVYMILVGDDDEPTLRTEELSRRPADAGGSARDDRHALRSCATRF